MCCCWCSTMTAPPRAARWRRAGWWCSATAPPWARRRRTARGVALHSLRLGLIGKADVVEFHARRSGPLQPYHGRRSAPVCWT